ncbi:protein COFACTOR ASSEMBLY OF COMPLEX C SUBUNIT B CCB4, chloroplastic isoform X2 [Aristolochia californica]|uniref:protein COFACTOR ASSEMBLY OF COMPLEX C SUBUNIT B CCB4, chloroplastic isoform X2 n=1 Tax=Aristolochia californica TaxID=171875 RepID=UPI0035E01985
MDTHTWLFPPIRSWVNQNRFFMETVLLRPIWWSLSRPRLPISRCSHSIKIFSSFSGKEENGTYKGPRPNRELVADWVSKNDDTVRRLPIVVGGVSLLAVLLNRSISGIAPVSDASSSQSRTDILTIGLAVTNILNGLVWLSIRPKYIAPVPPQGVQCKRVYPDIPGSLVSELIWFWESLSVVTCCRSLVVVHGNLCLLQIGVAAESSARSGEAVAVDPMTLLWCSLCQNATKSGTQRYLANLSLYPAKSELPFLPSNTQEL